MQKSSSPLSLDVSEKRFVRLEKAVEITGFSMAWFRKESRKPDFPALRAGRAIRVNIDEVVEYLRRRGAR